MIEIEDEKIDKTIEAMDILQRLAGECQQCRDELPENVVWVLSEWESFSEG